MSESEIHAALSVDNVRAHVEHLTENLPTRLAGSENCALAAEYNAERARAAGAEATVYTLPALVSFPGEAELGCRAMPCCWAATASSRRPSSLSACPRLL